MRFHASLLNPQFCGVSTVESVFVLSFRFCVRINTLNSDRLKDFCKSTVGLQTWNTFLCKTWFSYVSSLKNVFWILWLDQTPKILMFMINPLFTVCNYFVDLRKSLNLSGFLGIDLNTKPEIPYKNRFYFSDSTKLGVHYTFVSSIPCHFQCAHWCQNLF